MWYKSAWEKLWQGMWMSSSQRKNEREGKESVAAVSHQMTPHCLVSFTIRPGIIFRKLFLKLFVRFRYQWLLQQNQFKNPCDQKAARFSFPVILLTSNPAPQLDCMGLQSWKCVENCSCLSLEMSKAGPTKNLTERFHLAEKIVRVQPILILICEIFWSTFYWEMLSLAASRVAQGSCGDRKAKCCVVTRGKVWETSPWAPREGGKGDQVPEQGLSGSPPKDHGWAGCEGAGAGCEGEGVAERSCHGLTTAPIPHPPNSTHSETGWGISNEGVKVRLGERGGGVLIFSLFLTIQIYFNH